mgnify:CR=1 FL=1
MDYLNGILIDYKMRNNWFDMKLYFYRWNLTNPITKKSTHLAGYEARSAFGTTKLKTLYNARQHGFMKRK